MNSHNKRDNLLRRALAFAILLVGLAMIPFVDLPAATGWQALAGVYQPALEVQVASGPAGTVFTFTGSNYPPNSVANIYVDGLLSGTIETGADGQATFVLNTGGIPAGTYNVTLEVDINASETESITILPAPTPTATPSPMATPEPEVTATAAGQVAAATADPAGDSAPAVEPASEVGQPSQPPAERTLGAVLVIVGALLLAAVLIWFLARRLRH